ncbi:MAG TPA: hypothetical protein VMZ50_13120 [Phycisphaerae bacterium]|nr:hypothetical protein [Phycisphaerae bacterium]
MNSPGESEPDRRKAPPKPVDVVDGIPDRSATAAGWKYVLLAIVFLGWVAFLIYCAAAGNL